MLFVCLKKKYGESVVSLLFVSFCLFVFVCCLFACLCLCLFVVIRFVFDCLIHLFLLCVVLCIV